MRQSGSQRMGWRGALTLAVAVAAWLGAAPGARAGQIYVLTADDTYDSTPANFGVVDTDTGAYTQIAANVGGGENLFSLAWNPTLQKFYTGRSGFPSATLHTLGTDGVLSASLGMIGYNMYGMAYQPSSNTLFGYDYNSDDFGTVDPTTGAWTQINDSPGWFAGSPVGGRLAFHTGTLYGAANSGGGVFGTFDTSTGSFSQINNNYSYSQMALASDGTTLYGLFANGSGVGSQALYTINPADGALTFVTNITGTGLLNRFTGAAVAFGGPPPGVPEPGTVGLALVGAGVLGVRAWRRRGGRATA